MKALIGVQHSQESLGLDGDEERRWRNRVREEEGGAGGSLQYFWKMPHSHLAEEEGRGGGRGKEGMVGRGEEKIKAGEHLRWIMVCHPSMEA